MPGQVPILSSPQLWETNRIEHPSSKSERDNIRKDANPADILLWIDTDVPSPSSNRQSTQLSLKTLEIHLASGPLVEHSKDNILPPTTRKFRLLKYLSK